MVGNRQDWLGMAGLLPRNGRKWLGLDGELLENDWELQGIAGKRPRVAGNHQKWSEMAKDGCGRDENGREWLEKGRKWPGTDHGIGGQNRNKP